MKRLGGGRGREWGRVVAWGLVLCLAGGCAVQRVEPGPGESLVAPVSRAVLDGRGSVVVDPRIELMTVVQLLAGYPILTAHESEYRTEVLAHFSPWAGHTAVTEFGAMYRSGFAFDAVPKAFASMTGAPELRVGPGLPAEVAERAGGRAAVERLAERVGEFAEASDFAGFFRSRGETYRILVDSAAPAVARAVEQLEAYVGRTFTSSRVVLSPLLHDGGFAMRGGDPPVQAFVGPVGVEAGVPVFGDGSRLGPLIWHEFAHVLINPLTARARDRVQAAEIVDPTFRSTMSRQAYGDWGTIVSESVIRALEVRLAHAVVGPEAAARRQARQVDRGFCHVPALAEVLEEFETGPDRRAGLAAIYPRLLAVFEGEDRHCWREPR